MKGSSHPDAGGQIGPAASASVAVIAIDEVARRRIAAVLRAEGITVGAELATPADVIAHPADSAPSTVVMVCSSSITARATAIRTLRRHSPELHMIIVAPADSRNGVRRALEAGADGFVLDTEVADALVPTVRATMAGQLAVPRGLRHQVDRPTFSHREKQTLAMLVNGLTNAEIAGRMFLAESTVKCHLSSAFAKLGVRSRHEAVRIILDPEERLGLGILELPVDEPTGSLAGAAS